MILRFRITNFRSIRLPVEINFLSIPEYDRDVPSRYIYEAKQLNIEVLPVIGLFGGKASGKSTILEALSTFAKYAASVSKGLRDELPYFPFLLMK